MHFAVSCERALTMFSQHPALRSSAAPLEDQQGIRYRRAQRSAYGKLWHAVFDIKPPETALQKALEKFDPQVSNPSDEVLAHVARAYKLDHITFPSPEDKQWLLAERVEKDVMNMLAQHGYDQFSLGVQNGHNYLETSPRPGRETLSLPPWIDIPYLVRKTRPHVPVATNPKIESGAKIKDTSGRHIGTLGAIMCSPLENQPGLKYIAITAGHVIPDNDTHVLVYNDSTGEDVSLKVSSSSYRSEGKRLLGHAQRLGQLSAGFDEIAFLIFPPAAVKYVALEPYNINVHYFEVNAEMVEIEKKRNPVTNRYRDIVRKLRLSPVMVFKKGSETDLTMGRLIGIEKEAPPRWYKNEDEEEEVNTDFISFEHDTEEEESSFLDQNVAPFSAPPLYSTSSQSLSFTSEETSSSDGFPGSFSDSNGSHKSSEDDEERVAGIWYGKVQWMDNHTEFGAPGDSGSLVYAIESGVYVPLGIYLGTPEAWRAQDAQQTSCSCFISLETFAYGGLQEGLELVFPPA